MYTPVAKLVRFLLKLRGKLIVKNIENLPVESGYVIACTHRGWVDILALGVSILPVEIHFMAKKELFQSKAIGWFLRKINAFPVDRDNPGTSTVKIPIQLLKQGENVGIFPSGTRTSDEVPLKRGAVTIAKLARVPIVPAAYSGPTGFKDLFKRQPITIILGEPIYLDSAKKGKDELDLVTTELSDVFKALEQRISS
ncbi:lysophospholipid acyltransferase family protein [Bacillus cihuensis]|uniref:lysophospholipid acyltransferase family protein n=1 Tax=Bacillus cihuensis TaxID=1208599 RepID=UPI000406D69E|nr:lysophospholipid acyltransferase family protein [Bacillus cihuensis]